MTGDYNLNNYYGNSTANATLSRCDTVTISNTDDWKIMWEVLPQMVDLPNTNKEVEMKGLYEVIRCYGADRNSIQVKKFEEVVADSEEDAKIKSGVYATIDKSWDADFLTIIVRKLGDVKVKVKPQEVKNV